MKYVGHQVGLFLELSGVSVWTLETVMVHSNPRPFVDIRAVYRIYQSTYPYFQCRMLRDIAIAFK